MHLCQTEIVIFVLAGVVDYRANIQTLHPRVGWAVVEQTEIGAIPWQRAGQGESRRYKLRPRYRTVLYQAKSEAQPGIATCR